jgi:hypothetical protein
MLYNPEQFGRTIKAKYPQYNDMSDRDLGLKMLAKYPEYKDIVHDNSGALAFANQKGPSTSLAKNFVKSVPGATAKTFLGGPAKLLTSGFEGLATTIKTGGRENASGKTYNLPVIGPFQSFQSEAKARADRGMNPLLNIGLSSLEVAGAGLDTVGIGKGLTKLGSMAEKQAANLVLKKAANNVIKAENLAGKIIQGKTDDILQAKKALSSIDIKDIKTYKDLEGALDDKIQGISMKLDDALSSKSGVRKLEQLGTKIKAGNQTLDINHAKDALKQLDDYYTSTNNILGRVKVQNLIAKAEKQGLTIKEINDVARLHGKDLNAYNASGQLASGLTKQAAENTRTGVKTTARTLFDNKAYEAADEQLSALINTKTAVSKMKEAVNTLQQKVMQRTFGQKVGRLMAQVVDKLTGGGFKGFIQTFIPRGEGLKTFNALDLEKSLPKVLKQLQKAIDSSDEATLIKNLEDIIKNPKGLTELGETTTQIIRPGDLRYNGPVKQGPARVNNYQSAYPKYISPDQMKTAQVTDIKSRR